MTPLIITFALLAITAAGAWSWIRHNRAGKLAEQRAREESERLTAERTLAQEKAMAEAKARDDARLQAETEERSRKLAEARENARLAEAQRLAAEESKAEGEVKRVAEEKAFVETQACEAAHLKAEAEAKQRAEAEAREKARLAAEEEQRTEERAKAEAEERERARIAAEEEARRQAEEMSEEEKTASEPVVEAASQETEAKAETHGAQVSRDEIQSVTSEESEPPLAEDDQLPKAREFSEPKPSPIRKTSTKREPKPDSTPRTDVTSPIRLQLVFGRGGSVKTLALVPHRREGMPSNIEVTTANGQLRLSEWSADSYEPVPVCDVPNALSEGVVFQARCGAQLWRWELSRRELYVLAAGDEFGLRGFVTRRKDQRLWLNTRHVVLAKESLRDQVVTALAEAGCATPEVSDSTTPGVPPGWILFLDVTPTRAVPMRDERDILNVLCPAHENEPRFVGGIKLETNVWLTGFPPRIRFTGELGSGIQVLIDGQPTLLANDGAFEAPGWDAEGEHRLWFGGRAETYSLRSMKEEWDSWHAHDFGTGAAICGASTHRTDGARWRQVRIPTANPLLVGARPGEIFCCQSRHDVRSEAILALVPFAPAWALPIDPAHADKRSVRLVVLDSLEPSDSAEQSSRNQNSNRALKQWIAAIRDAARKQLALAVENEDSKALWRRYHAVAKQLWKRMR